MNEQLNQIVREMVESLHESDAVAIAPGEVAESVYVRIDPHRLAPLMVQASSKNDLRRRAEGELRNIYRDENSRVESGQSDAFSDHLQTRYPCDREGVKVYVAPEHMSDDELTVNAQRLRSEGDAKIRHADRLEAYRDSRNSASR